MKPGRKAGVAALALLLLTGNASAYALSPGEGVVGSDGRILSEIETMAGSGHFDDENGILLEADFRSPEGLTVLEEGTVLVADTGNHRIRAIAGDEVATFAGVELPESDETGLPAGAWLDGERDTAVFQRPMGIASDTEGNIYIADALNHAIRKVDADGKVTTLAGDGILGDRDGRGAEARLHHPSDVAVAADGTVYVADTLNHLIRSVDPEGNVATLNAAADRLVEVHDGYVAVAGDYKDGPIEEALFNEPSGLAIDAKGNLYVADSGNHRIRYIDLQSGTVTTVAGGGSVQYGKNALYAASGYADGSAHEARFHSPGGIALTEEGGLVIADRLNHAVRYLHNGEVITLAGSGSQGDADGVDGMNRLEFPADVAVTKDGDILIADAYNNKIRRLSLYRLPGTVSPDRIDIVIGTEPVPMDAEPEIVNGRTMVPVRAVSEQLGYTVDYDAGAQSVLLSKDGISVRFHIGATNLEVTDGSGTRTTTMDVAPYIREEWTFVPIRFFSEEFGLDVDWDAVTRTVILR